jgi:hypothetical protein
MMTVTGKAAVNYTFDNANRLTQVAQGTVTLGFGYDTARRRTTVTFPNSIIGADRDYLYERLDTGRDYWLWLRPGRSSAEPDRNARGMGLTELRSLRDLRLHQPHDQLEWVEPDLRHNCAQFNACIAIDQTGAIGSCTSRPAAPGLGEGADVSCGLSLAYSPNACSIQDLAGLFTNVSLGGWGPHASGDAYVGTGAQGQFIGGGGITLGAGLGQRFSTAITTTTIGSLGRLW